MSGITVYKAIEQMRELTREGKSFSIAFMSCDTSRQKSQGIVEVHRAKLRKQTPSEDDRFGDIKLNYVDCDTGEARNFYQPLLMAFNGIKTELT